MANAAVDKLKALGLRHGEKAVVALTAALCLLFLVVAVAKPTIDLTYTDIKNHAEQSQQNIDKPQKEEDILAKLEDEGLKNPAFEKTVDNQSVAAIDAAKFALLNPWVTPEPGAGLIRDMPVLIAITDLYARPGRGGALMYDLKDGKRIPELSKDAPKLRRFGRRRSRRLAGNRGMMGSGGMRGGGGYGGTAAGKRKNSAEEAAKKKEERAAEERKLAGMIVGKEKIDTAKEKEKEDEEKAAELAGRQQNWKEVTNGLRWVALVGTLDNKKLRENYATALKQDFSSVYPNYQRLDVERQELQDDGAWSDWKLVSRDENLKVLNNLPEADEELTPDEVRLETIADLLPFLRAGYWKGVHIASLVPKEKRELAKEAPPTAGGPYGASMQGAGAGPGGGSSYGAMMQKRGGASAGGYGGGGAGAPPAAGGSSYGGMMRGSGGMRGGYEGGGGYGGGAGYGGGGTTENSNFPKSEAEQIMARSLDFTVDPDTTYRFRVRIVVANPNLNREDVSPGVDIKAEELFGPWSDPSDQVTVPADVTAYAMSKPRGGENVRSDQVQFQVVRWTPDDGLTVYKVFEAGPGQILGEPRSVTVPNYDEADTRNSQPTKVKPADFNTRQMVLDTSGGFQPLPRNLPGIFGGGAGFDDPASALMLRPDGKLVLRDESVDTHNDEMAEMKEIYVRAVKEAEDSKKSNTGSSYGAGMGAGMPKQRGGR